MPARCRFPRMVTTNAGWFSRCSEIRTSRFSSGRGARHQVMAVDLVERRDVELLHHDRGLIAVGREQVCVASAVGVVHLGDDVAQCPAGVVAPVQADAG